MKKILSLVLVVVLCITYGTVVSFAEEGEVVNCGYLKNAGEFETDFGSYVPTVVKVQVFDEYGNGTVYSCAENITINGVTYSNTTLALGAIAVETYAEFVLNSDNEIVNLTWNTLFPQGWQINASVEHIAYCNKIVTADLSFNRIKENCIVLLAVYNGGVLINVDSQRIVTTDSDVSLSVGTDKAYSRVATKIFFWNSFTGLKPLARVIENLILHQDYQYGRILATAEERAEFGINGFVVKLLMNTPDGDKVLTVKDGAKLKIGSNDYIILDMSSWEDSDWDDSSDINSDYAEIKALVGKDVKYIVGNGLVVEIVVDSEDV